MLEYEVLDACLKLLRDMFMLKPGETIAITTDTMSSDEIVEATAQAAVILGAKPLIFKIAAPEGAKAGDKDMPMKALIDGIKACDAWVEFNYKLIFYSTVYDKITEDPNNRPRYMNQNGVHPELLVRNIGKVDNRGIELAVNWRKKITNDLNMDLRFNLTYNKNKYIYKDEPDYPYVWQSETGKPLSNTIGYIAEGLFKDQADIEMSPSQDELGSTVMPGDIKYRDVNGDGKINSKDQVMISQYGNVPRIQYGIGLDMTYKSFDFGLFFNGSAQRTIMVSGIMPFRGDASTGDRNVMQFIANDYWSEANPNPDAKFPRLGITDSQVANNSVNSTYWMHNGRFIRFKTLELGYSFPYCRVYINGDNLAVWSPFKEWDPELSWNAYPLQRTINIGVQLKF